MRHRLPPGLTAVFVVLGFLLATAGYTAAAGRRAEAPRKAELIRLIQARQSQVADLTQGVRDLRNELSQATRAQSQATQADRQQAARLGELALAAGTAAVAGPGVVVHLADSAQIPAGTTDPGAYRIHDSDLQLVVNALFAAGAEAVSVNGNRLVATSPIRAAGATIVVNFEPLSSPYDVSAIGADAGAFQASEIARRFKRWTTVFGLGFSVRTHSKVTVPGFTGRTSIAAAVPVDAGTGAAG